MSEIDISYKGSTIASMNASGTKTLLTQGKYCEDDIEVVYTRPSAPAPFVKGSFTTGSSSGSSYIDLPYTGNGYPIAVMVFLHDGTYNPDSSVYSVVKRYGILAWSMTKAVTSTTPVYGSTSGVDENMGVVNAVYKSSTSDATAVTTSVNKAANVYLTTAAGNAYYTAVRVRSNTRLGYYVIGSSSFGLMPSTTYDYIVIYSS